MSSLKDILSNTSNELLSESKDEVLKLLSQALSSNNEFVKKNVEKIERWTVMLSEGEIDKEEFDGLVSAQRRKVDQYLNTVEINLRSEAEKITHGLIKIVVNQVVPIL